MLSIFSRIRRSFKTVEVPLDWYDPAALPGAPILVLYPPVLNTCTNREKSVQWWNKNTPTVVGVFSPTLRQNEQLQGDSQPTIFGFNIETGSSYLPDCSGDISWDTIRCSTEEGGDNNAISSSPSSSSSESITTLILSSNSSYSSDSNLSMVITDGDNEESFYFPASEFPKLSVKRKDFTATSLLPTKEIDEIIRFGDGFPPKRVSTITRLVGDAIRDRRSRLREIVDDMFCAETSVKPYRCGGPRHYIPHTLTTIVEDEDEQ